MKITKVLLPVTILFNFLPLDASLSTGSATVDINETTYVIKSRKYSDYNFFVSDVQSNPWYSGVSNGFTSAYEFAMAAGGAISGFTGPRPGIYGPHFVYHLTDTNGDGSFNTMGWVRNHGNASTHSSNGYDNTMANDASPINIWNNRYVAFVVSSSPTVTDTGDASYSISGDTYAGSSLTAVISTDDPDGNGTVTSYTWQSSSDGSTWSDISGATSSTYTITPSEEGKSIRVTVAYTDGSSTSESVTASSVSISQLHTEWVQSYAAMQNIGLASIKNHRDLVLEKAGECNNMGWQVGDTDYCVYTNAKNTISYVNSSSTKGGYDTAAFNTALNIEKTINDKWKAGISYGYGSANLDNFNFSDTRANFNSYNSHYYLYGVKKASDKFTLKATFGGSDFDYYGYRNYGTYSSTVATSYYDADAFSGEINGIWNYKKYLDISNNPIRLRPTAGIAYAIHNQDELSETGTGDLISIDKNQSESLLLKTGITVDRQIQMEKGKWILIPSFGIDLAYDFAADGENTKGVKGKLTNSTTAATHVNAKNFGVVNAVAKLGADIVCTKDLMFSLNATIGVTNKGDQRSYGGGFRWHF